jgi:hypothetical protein
MMPTFLAGNNAAVLADSFSYSNSALLGSIPMDQASGTVTSHTIIFMRGWDDGVGDWVFWQSVDYQELYPNATDTTPATVGSLVFVAEVGRLVV